MPRINSFWSVGGKLVANCGYCFVTFADPVVASMLIQQRYITIGGKRVECKAISPSKRLNCKIRNMNKNQQKQNSF